MKKLMVRLKPEESPFSKKARCFPKFLGKLLGKMAGIAIPDRVADF